METISTPEAPLATGPSATRGTAMRQAVTRALGILLVANAAIIVASPVLYRFKAGAIVGIAVEVSASFAAAFLVARRAPWGGYWIGLSMLVPATALWVLHNFVYSINGVGADFGSAKGHILVAIFSAGINLFLCIVGADIGADLRVRDLRRKAASTNWGPAPPRPRGLAWHAAWIVGAAFGLLFLVYLAWGLAFTWGTAKANIWIVPDQCIGWVKVDYGVPGAPALPMEDGFGVIRVPVDGLVRTSSPIVTSPNIHQYWYERDGKRVSKAPSTGGWTSQAIEDAKTGSERITVFEFIGSREDYEALGGRERSTAREPTPGLIRCR